MTELLRGLFLHIYLLLTLQHDGSGLPTKKSGAFVFLFVVGLLATVTEIVIAGQQSHLFGAVLLYCLTILMNIFLFGRHGWTIASAYTCLLTGIILVEGISLSLHGPSRVFFGVYQLVVMIVAFARIMRAKP